MPEIKENAEVRSSHVPKNGWIFYDGDCRSCTASAKAFERIFAKRGFDFIPLQTPWVQKRLGLDPSAPLEEMRVLTRDERDIGGADAVIFLARQIWWARPFCWLARLPGAHRLLDRAYRWVAAHRGCTHVACTIPRRRSWPGWLGLLLFPTLALLTRNRIEPWQFMWLMAAVIFLACKWLTFWRAKNQIVRFSLGRVFSYFLLWPGMDAEDFLAYSGRGMSLPQPSKLIFAIAKTAMGALFLFIVARLTSNPLLAGWIGMTGMIFILHFGLFDLAGIGWRALGVNVRPIMDAPIRSTSLNEFWGRRWNGAFNQLVLDTFFRRAARSLGVFWATLIAFLISGLIHELVISVPARAGYGLPTAYFVLQGLGVIAQRKLQLRHGLAGWISTMLVIAGQAFWLFHPPFVRQVIIPFMHAIHAL